MTFSQGNPAGLELERCRRDDKRLNHSTSKAEKKTRILPIFGPSLPLDKVG